MRKFLDEIREEIANSVYPNKAGAIKPTPISKFLGDMLDSLAQNEAGMLGSDPLSFDIDENWVSISDAVVAGQAYDQVIGGDNDFLKVSASAGTITGTETAGFSYETLGAITLDAGANKEIEAAIGLDGVPGAYVASVIGTGGARFQSMYLSRYTTAAPANGVFSLMVRAPNGSETISVEARTFGSIVVPTQNP
jgi:hypothetical protein